MVDFRIFIFILSLSICTLLIYQDYSYSQAVGGGASAAPSAPTPPDFPSYIVYPTENLNPYGLSDMRPSTESGNVNGVGTLGQTIKRKSNIEINAPKEESVEQKDDNDQENSGNLSTENQQLFEQQPDFSPKVPRSSGRVFTWMDDNGMLHVTNDLGTIPPEHQKQVLEESNKNSF